MSRLLELLLKKVNINLKMSKNKIHKIHYLKMKKKKFIIIIID